MIEIKKITQALSLGIDLPNEHGSNLFIYSFIYLIRQKGFNIDGSG